MSNEEIIGVKVLLVIILSSGIWECVRWRGSSLSSGLIVDFIEGCVSATVYIIALSLILAAIVFLVKG